MSAISYVFKLLGLEDLETQRHNQILRQGQLDAQVTTRLGQCPDTIARYYLLQRLITRRQQIDFISTPLSNKVGVLRQQLAQNAQFYDDLETALNAPDFCQRVIKVNST